MSLTNHLVFVIVFPISTKTFHQATPAASIMESSELIQENQLNRHILEDYDRMLKSVTEIDNPQRKCHILNEVYKMKLKYFRLSNQN